MAGEKLEKGRPKPPVSGAKQVLTIHCLHLKSLTAESLAEHSIRTLP